jgi:4-amino-4-deoxy-L-arabinose transferase-like glycosyltransferase
LLYAIGSRLFGRATGLLAALFAAVYGPFVMVTGLILTESIFLASFLALIYFQVRMIQQNRLSDHIWAGVFLALSVLIRPNCLIVAATPYLFLWMRERQLYMSHLLSGIGAFALAMSPWWLRNAMTFHEFVFIARGEAGNPFLGGTDPYGKVPIDWNIPAEKQFSEGIRRIQAGLSTDPLLWLRWFTFGKLSVMFKNSIYWWPYPQHISTWYAETLRVMHYAITYIGIFIGVLFAYFRWPLAFVTANLMLFLGVHLLFVPEPRYTIGMMPLLMLITAYTLVTVVCHAASTGRHWRLKSTQPVSGPL